MAIHHCRPHSSSLNLYLTSTTTSTTNTNIMSATKRPSDDSPNHHHNNDNDDNNNNDDTKDGRNLLPPITKKTKTRITDNEKSLPLYGTQEYWDQRYQHLLVPSNNTQATSSINKNDNEDQDNDDTPLPYHAWYFTYDELRPLVLPCILGGRQTAFAIFHTTNNYHDNNNNNDDDDEQEEDDHENDEQEDDHKNKVIGPESRSSEGQEVQLSLDKQDTSVDNSDVDDVDDDSFVEVDPDEDESDEDEDNQDVERPGLSQRGPIQVLEIGCGDVPLGVGLALELQDLQQQTGALSKSLVERIVCTDYSPTVIALMKQQYPSVPSNNGTSTDKQQTSSSAPSNRGPVVPITAVSLDFETADARQLPYKDSSFACLLEKGTLDAMLSDPEHGQPNCIQIVSECARVLQTPGILLLISHLNAHTDRGKGWLQDVVWPGLQQGDATAMWEMEVHGSDQIVTDNDNDSDTVQSLEQQQQQRAPSGTPGPAVYIIHKTGHSTKSDNNDTNKQPSSTTRTIPVKFYAY